MSNLIEDAKCCARDRRSYNMSRSYRRDYSTWLKPLPKGSERLNEEPHSFDKPSAGYGPAKKCKGKGTKAYEPGAKRGIRFHCRNSIYTKDRV